MAPDWCKWVLHHVALCLLWIKLIDNKHRYKVLRVKRKKRRKRKEREKRFCGLGIYTLYSQAETKSFEGLNVAVFAQDFVLAIKQILGKFPALRRLHEK